MDYSLAALKLFCGQLKDARPTSPASAMTLGGILFQRAWLQGVLVSGQDEGCYILDDGSDVIELHLTNEFQQEQWKTGMYVMVIGVYVVRPNESPVIKFVHYKITAARTLKLARMVIVRSNPESFARPSLSEECLAVHKIVDLSHQPDREAMWHLEVIEAYKLFYQPSFDE